VRGEKVPQADEGFSAYHPFHSMLRLTRPLLAVALFAFASFAHAESLRLLAPANGATLRGGSNAELQWSAAELPAGDEEWEAFLSVDGGRYYGFRVTPHLDITLRRFTFVVPNIDTLDARILIRTGDEEHESEFEARGSFSIVRDPDAEPVAAPLVEHAHGEAAREGDPAVLSWTEGARNGSGITRRSSTAQRTASVSQPHPAAVRDEWVALTPTVNWLGTPSIASAGPSARPPLARKVESLPLSADLLLFCRRRNI
jgi:hypothetical protein